jgi:hypothetical protein
MERDTCADSSHVPPSHDLRAFPVDVTRFGTQALA